MSNTNITQSTDAPEPAQRRAPLHGELSALVHELNQPLTAIQMYAEAGCALLAREGSDPDLLQSLFEKIVIQSARGNKVSDELRSILRESKAAPDLHKSG